MTLSNEEKVALVVPVTSVEVTGSEAMFTLCLSTLLLKCLMKRLGRFIGLYGFISFFITFYKVHGIKAVLV